MEEPGVIGPPFNLTFQVRARSISTITNVFCAEIMHSLFSPLVSQIQNLGYFPVKDLQLNIEIPEMTKNGKHFLHIADFSIDQVRVGAK